MKTRLMLATCWLALVGIALSATTAQASLQGWDVGWNDMATVSGGTSTNVLSTSKNLQYVQIAQAPVDFADYEFLVGGSGDNSWSDVFGDQGQHFFDGAVRNAWYDGSVPGLTAYDWAGSTGIPASGTFEWLLNNYARDEQGNPSGTPKNSHIRGTDSSFTYNESTGEFIANLTSDGTWYWYTPGTPDSPMDGWIKDFDWTWDADGDFASYYGRYMTGNFRLVGTFGQDNDGLPTFTSATLQYEVGNVPEPTTFVVWSLLGLMGIGFYQRLARTRRNR